MIRVFSFNFTIAQRSPASDFPHRNICSISPYVKTLLSTLQPARWRFNAKNFLNKVFYGNINGNVSKESPLEDNGYVQSTRARLKYSTGSETSCIQSHSTGGSLPLLPMKIFWLLSTFRLYRYMVSNASRWLFFKSPPKLWSG